MHPPFRVDIEAELRESAENGWIVWTPTGRNFYFLTIRVPRVIGALLYWIEEKWSARASRSAGAIVLALMFSWQGLFVGFEHTALWREPLRPGISASATALVGVGRVSLRAVYIQPLQRGGYGPAVQLGGSMRVF